MWFWQGCKGHQPYTASKAPTGVQYAPQRACVRHSLNTALQCSRQQGRYRQQGRVRPQQLAASVVGTPLVVCVWHLARCFAGGQAASGKCSHLCHCLLSSLLLTGCVLQRPPKAGVVTCPASTVWCVGRGGQALRVAVACRTYSLNTWTIAGHCQ